MSQSELDWNWTDTVTTLWTRRVFVVIAFIVAGGLAAGVALLLPRTHLATATVKIGRVLDRPIQDPVQLTAWIRTPGFASIVHKRGAVQIPLDTLLDNLTAEPVVQTPPTPFVSVLVRAASPDAARRLTKTATEVILEDHAERYERMLERQTQYRDLLRQQIESVQRDLASLDDSLTRFRARPTVDAPAVLLMQAQLEDKQSQVLGFQRELRDLEVNLRSLTEETAVIGDIVLPRSELRPRRSLIAVGGAVTGGLLAVFWVLVTAGVPRGMGPAGHQPSAGRRDATP